MIILKFDQVSKRYQIYREPEEVAVSHPLVRKLRALWGHRALWGNSKDFWALSDVSFGVERGESLGIIGHNGAGKSTILKLLYNITAPTRGEITIRGRLSALIEVASGFHPELTGRENIFLNGSLLGMPRREIASKLDRIVDFAGVAPFIDTPVKRYSLGMYLRLGFAIAAHLDPDILLLDEVLAVGDAAFQAKCIERINELRKAGKTIVFVSHNLGAVENLCDRVLLIQQGRIVKSGPPREVISEYESRQLAQPASLRTALTHVAKAPPAEILSLSLFDSQGRRAMRFSAGDPLRAEVEFVVHDPVRDAVIEIYFYSNWGNLHGSFSTESSGERIDLEPGSGTVEFSCPGIALEVASYNVEASIKHRGSQFSEHIDYKHGAVINLGPGKPVKWRRKGSNEASHDREVEVIVKDTF